ncbi:MAG: dihydrolipoyllysine-residue acetyltransferase, partial [Burkholderiaceae bacterium]
MGQLVEIKIPDIGDFKEVEVIEVLVKPGDTVTKEQSLITVESDKASMEIPSSDAGVVRELKLKVGDKVAEGSLVLMLEAEGLKAEAAPAAAAPKAAAASPPPTKAAASPAPSKSTAVAPPSASQAGPIEVAVPDIGDFKDVEVIEVLVKPGDRVAVEQSLITVESDKASMEIPSSAAGVVRELRVKIGDKVAQGSVVLVLDGDASTPSPAGRASSPPPAAAAPVSAAPPATPKTTAFATEMAARPEPIDLGPAPGSKAHASPSVRKFARELGVDLQHVRGSGLKGRITPEDVREHVKAVMAGGATAAAPAAAAGLGLALPAWPQIDFSKFGAMERVDMSRIRKISGPALTRNSVLIPHVTNHDDADITDLEAFRVQLNKENEKSGAKLTMLAFLIKACIAALKKFPEFNTSLDGDQLVYKQYYHIGFAADTPNGLVVPVLRDADKKGVLQISTEMGELAKKARDGKMGPADMTGGCFSISSLGGIGGTHFTPII